MYVPAVSVNNIIIIILSSIVNGWNKLDNDNRFDVYLFIIELRFLKVYN